MMIWIMLAIVATAVMITLRYRTQRDTQLLNEQVQAKGGKVLRLKRVTKGHPFASIGRGWWAWLVEWQGGDGQTLKAYALTTREGVSDWRD